jgi:hypothetical protein
VVVASCVRICLVALASFAGGCVSQSSQAKLVADSGSAFIARGVVDAISVFGRGCPGHAVSTERNIIECGSGGSVNPSADLATIGASFARAALGVALWSLADKPVQQPDAAAPRFPARRLLDDSGRSELSRARSSRLPVDVQLECDAAGVCRSELDPRRAISLQ